MCYEVNTGVDIHATNCVDILEYELTPENRQNTKPFNFGYIYGISAYGCHTRKDMPDFPIKKWREIIKTANRKYWKLVHWQNENIATVWKTGELQIKTGRKFRFLKNRTDKDGVPCYNENLIKNAPVQGIAGGDALPLAACVIRRGLIKYQLESEFRLTIHDSLVIDYKAKELEPLTRLAFSTVNNLHRYMSNYFRIPWQTMLAGDIKIGKNYGALKEIRRQL
jgi:DNA polymerase I-like protein with 3'-5' exonuclease and polymerase domains